MSGFIWFYINITFVFALTATLYYLLMMALGDTDDLACSQHGRHCPVVLYCITCHMLLCPRCVSYGPAGEDPAHRDHTYIEIQDAHDMFKV